MDISPNCHDDYTIAPFATFPELEPTGTIAPDVRFQDLLPTLVVRGFVEDDGVCAQAETLYEERLLHRLLPWSLQSNGIFRPD